MSEKLFRTQAQDKQLDQLKGDVLLLPPLPVSLLSLSVVLILVAITVYLALGSYARSERVIGYVAVAEGSLRLTVPREGLVKRLLVTEGEEVRRGEPLLIINGDRILTNGERVEAQLLKEYEKQQQLLTNKLMLVPQKFDHRQQELNTRLEASERERVLLRKQLINAEQREALAAQMLQKFRTLHQSDFISQKELNEAQASWLNVASEKEAQERSLMVLSGQIDLLKVNLAGLVLEQHEEASDLQNDLSQLAQQIAQLNGERTYVLEAPRDGKVTGLVAQEGQRLVAHQFVLTLLPTDKHLQASLYVPSKAIGFVASGQSVLLRYDAFPYQKFGLYRGTIQEVAQAPSLPGEQILPIDLNQAMYRTRVQLETDSVLAYGKHFSLKPGMTLEADIQLGERSLLEWLLEPIFSIK